MSLTENQVKRSVPRAKIYFLTDDDGLSLKIEPNGRKSWTYRYTVINTTKRRRVTLGVYPLLSLKDARNVRDQFKLDPSQAILTNKKLELSFKQVSEEWLDFKKRNSFNDQPRCGVVELARRCLEKEIYPILSDVAFKDVGRSHLVQVIKKIEERNVKEPVQKAYSYLNQIYDYAVAMGYCDFNRAYGLNKIILKTKLKKNYPYLRAHEIGSFVKKLNHSRTHPIIKKAILFKLYTGVRGGELLLAEPHHFDLNNKIWKIPALHIKQFRRKVMAGYEIPDFIVPLSSQAMEILESALVWSVGEKYVFCSPRFKDRPIHFNTINSVIRNMGYEKNRLTSHGLRSTFSTILNESGLFQESWIEAQLSHVDKNKTRASYNHAEYLPQRKEMMQWWGNYLQEIQRDLSL
ncbi:integrase (plasmid) [Acinetobacter sp. NCu2D-2]|uniref:tyrosine-type recombinase/integrase n=1 Tax=Acinetobacter sp. NCu2D-2 TaxID=1608473 RepID=UPI0007CDB6AA|nr:tyrosine-type recombinase/integrase [Acinetobacter sp. NCu2D-2]ANF83434.1 integrase [Acinetobacter sp. NCu2D-2]